MAPKYTPPPVPARLVFVAPTLKGSRPQKLQPPISTKRELSENAAGGRGPPSLLGIRVAAALGTPVCRLLAMTPDTASLESERDGGSERLRFPCRAAWLQCQPQTEGTAAAHYRRLCLATLQGSWAFPKVWDESCQSW